MDRIQSKKSDLVLNIPNEKREKEREIRITEQHRHRYRYEQLHARPEIDNPAFGNERKHIANKKDDNQGDSGYALIYRRRLENEIKRQNIKDDPDVGAESCTFIKNLIPLLHVATFFLLLF